MFKVKLNEGGQSGFDKNCPNGVNNFNFPSDAARFIEVYLGKNLDWENNFDFIEFIDCQTVQITTSGEPIAVINPIRADRRTIAQKNMQKYWN